MLIVIYAEHCVFTVMLNGVMLNGVMLNGVMLNGVVLSVVASIVVGFPKPFPMNHS